MKDHVQLHAFIYGRVQGVFFRDFTSVNARRLGLTGWVRNLRDGRTVEVLAQGSRSQLEELLRIIGRGPPEASVEKVDKLWEDTTEHLGAFDLRW